MSLGVNAADGGSSEQQEVSHGTEEGMEHMGEKKNSTGGRKYFKKKNQPKLCQMRILDKSIDYVIIQDF